MRDRRKLNLPVLLSSSALITAAKRKDLTKRKDIVLWNEQTGNLRCFRYYVHSSTLDVDMMYLYACVRKAFQIYVISLINIKMKIKITLLIEPKEISNTKNFLCNNAN